MQNNDTAEGWHQYSFYYNLLNAVEHTVEVTLVGEGEEPPPDRHFVHSWSYADCAKGLDTDAQALNHIAYPPQEVCRACEGSGALAWTLLLVAIVLMGLQFIALFSLRQFDHETGVFWIWSYACRKVRGDSCLPLTFNALAIHTPFQPYAPHSTRGIIGRFWMLHIKGLVIMLIGLFYFAFQPCINAIEEKVGVDQNKNLNHGPSYICIMLSVSGYIVSYVYEFMTVNIQYQLAAKKWDERESAEADELMEMELGEMDTNGDASVPRYLAEKWLAASDEVLGPISSMIYRDVRALNVIGAARGGN